MHKRRACHGARSAPWSAHSVVKHAQKSVCTNYEVPTGNLDSGTTVEVMGLLKESSRKYNQTILMVTHNEALAQACDRIIRIEDGKLYRSGKVPAAETAAASAGKDGDCL